MAVRGYVIPLFLLSAIGFAVNKFVARPWILESEPPGFLRVFVLSFPYFAEAIMGTLLLAGIATELRSRFRGQLGRLGNPALYGVSSCVAAFYVLSQEATLHNLGGNNTYDPYDVLASVLGLALTHGLLLRYQFHEGSAGA